LRDSVDEDDEDEVPVKSKYIGVSKNKIDTSLVNAHVLNHSPEPLKGTMVSD